jgi:O-antigen biosynthesis protein
LANGKTFHVNLSNPDHPASVIVADDIAIHAPVEGAWEFTAMMACHRGLGKLELAWQQGNRRQVRYIHFSPTYKGGKHARSFQLVKERIQLKEGPATFSLSINHNGFVPDQRKRDDTLYLIANPTLSSPQGLTNQSEATIPRTAREDISKIENGDTYVASVVPFASPEDSPISIQWEDGRLEQLFSPLQGQLKLAEDYGHLIKVEASSSGTFCLYINKQFSSMLKLNAGINAVNLPTQWLRGEPILVEIRDASGSQIYLAHPVLAPRHLTPADLLLQETKRPFPTDLTCRANHRYQALRAHLRHPIPGISQDALLQALDTLDADYATLQLKPLNFPEVANPEVSVVIPAHNKVEATYYALAALLLAHNNTSFEVILVDDGSSDETAEIEELVSGIRVIRNAEPLRFIKACNKGASEARGTYVVLLNNDTEVTLRWLDALVDAFQRFDGVGAVGSKLLYPDGTLQDAGGIIWGSGNPWNYGNKQNPWDPRFCYTRQVDYLSGAALMTTKAIWDEVGGLSSYLEPMYFDDTDFSFKISEAGYKTYFVPSSVVYHFEGTTSGTDTSSGFKKYQEVNRPKFKRRWAKAFSRHGEEGVNPDLEKDRGISGRILFIDYTTPRQDQDAGSYAAIREIELVQALGYKVTFLPQNLGFFGNYTEELQRMGVEVITAPFYLSLAAFLEERGKEFDAAYITRYNVAADTVHLIREFSPKTRIILNNADLHFLRALRAAISEGDEAKLEAMRDIRNQELAMMRSVDLVLSYNEVEHVVISSHTDGAVKVMTCPWVVDIPETVAPLAGRAGLSFLGSFKHHPNAEGVQWFCQEVMPQLEAQQLKLSIYGSGLDDDIKDLASEWIDPVGYIEDVADAYQRHRVFVAPLLSGAGIKGKVLNALAYGIPTVLTPTAAEGIGLRHGHDCLIAKTPEEWVEGITRLCQDDELWASISHAARSYAASQFSFAAGKLKMKAAFEAVDMFTHSDL